ncbi:MAG: hypothetical protein ACXW2G_13715 [Burkholderiaceae bacterium]
MNVQTLAAATIAAWALSACSAMNGKPATDQHTAMDAGQKCAMYRETTEGRSPSEQRAAAEAHIVSMHGSADAAHVDRHLRMMEQMCGGKPAAGVVGR